MGAAQIVERDVAKDCEDMREFREKVARHYEREVVQLSLALPKPKIDKAAS